MKAGLTVLLLIPLFLSLVSCQGQDPLQLNEGEILNELHANNIGQLVFMKDWVPFADFTEADLTPGTLTIDENANLGFRMFLGKTLTSYLHELAPELSVEELCNKGNFQLTFFVDGKQLYQYNLQTGAGSCSYKNSATVYGVPLIDQGEPDHWGRFLWMKFLAYGSGRRALAEGTHLLKLEIRPYVEADELVVGELIAEGSVSLRMVREEKEVSEADLAVQRIAPTDQWSVSKYSYDTSLVRKLNQRIANQYFKDITSIVVIKDGELLLEEYFNGANRSTLHDTRSVGKTLASSVMGIAIDEGHIASESMTLDNFYTLEKYDHYSPGKEDVTLESLLAMSSGFSGSDMDPKSPGNEENMYPTSDWVKFALDQPMDPDKVIGKDWDYFTAGAVLLGDILHQSVPGGLEQYAAEKLFTPLGINDYQWQYTPMKVANTAGGFRMSALDNARYGQLYLDGGEYQGAQVLPAAWVAASLTKQVAIPQTTDEYYGYLLWNKQYRVNDEPHEAFYASGFGGNKIMIFQDLGTVIVITATAYGKPYMHVQVDEIIEEYLLPMLVTPR